ncbi:MAG TPA: DUF3450 family protein [Planctomycetota bacterium]|nr:DUF3450 family protein [Planctomycetota bacterium]
MKSPLRIATALAVLAAAGVSTGQDPPPSGTPGELEKIVRALREERAAYYERRRARAARLEEARSAEKKLSAEIAEFRRREEEIDRESAGIRAEVEHLSREAEAVERARRTLEPGLERLRVRALSHVEAGLPYRREDRAARLRPAAPGEGVSALLGRLAAHVEEEIRVARTGETWTAEVPVGEGRLRHARIFRVGHHAAGFVTEDGREAGLWLPAQGWTRDLSPEEREAVRRAVEILDRREAPGLVLLPVAVPRAEAGR